MVFKKAKQNRIFQDIVDQIQQAILKQELQPGEKLPPERAMCSIFNTSRGTLREALRILEQKKLIVIKLGAGGGAIVREPNSELIGENMSLLLHGNQGSLSQLIEFAAEIFGQLAALAAAKTSAEDIESLKQLVIRISEVIEQQKSTESILIQMDTLLLEELSRIVGNPFYVFFLQAALDAIAQEVTHVVPVNEAEQKQHYQEIRVIVYAVAKNEQQKAAQSAADHFRRLIS
jgi:DNA-binding FadR family transcriptional regulator